ncbi:hypothetical protein K438DRAFT_1880772 [Mycena galopus ATCC 62051]|nr:hypothetical protein K438DRAFT_1880772 [Mycena galopus ATCC 62051]
MKPWPPSRKRGTLPTYLPSRRASLSTTLLFIPVVAETFDLWFGSGIQLPFNTASLYHYSRLSTVSVCISLPPMPLNIKGICAPSCSLIVSAVIDGTPQAGS